MAYDKAQFEAAFQLITAVSHQIIKIDFEEMEVWVEKLMGPKALKDEETKKNLNNLRTVMRSYTTMKEVLRIHGVPVRDVQHYRDSVVQSPGENPNPEYRG
jgi:hypothetical protein